MIVSDEKGRETLLEAGRRLRAALDAVRERIAPGVSAKDLDTHAHGLITAAGDTPAFLGYRPSAVHPLKFPGTLCVSVNDEMVHGIPGADKVLRDGDVVSVDCGLEHDGMFVDAAYTVVVGNGTPEAHALVDATRRALRYATVVARAGARTGDIGAAVETVAGEYGYTVPPELGGHGLGAALHEDPFIPNIGDPGRGTPLREGEVIAVEPIFSESADPTIKLGDDGFVYRTPDGAIAAHFEHTLLLTAGAPVIVTGPMW